MTAREEAIDAGALALWKRDGWLPDDYPEKALIHRLSVSLALDAIPDGVLVRYAIERGALVETAMNPDDNEGGWHSYDDPPFYRRTGRRRVTARCPLRCPCLCHDTGGGVHDHEGRPCPGKG